MKLRDKIFSIRAIAEAKIFKKKTPLLVSWAITNRCNKNCAYCNIWRLKTEELDTGQVFSIIDELYSLGTKVIHFTGGEALLREDLGAILAYCRNKGISTSINSNGSLVEQRIEELIDLNLLGLSLDGPEKVHDAIRGKGSYREVNEAIMLAMQRGIRLRIHTVLSRSNLKCIDFLLERAREVSAPVLFQPSTTLLLGGEGRNNSTPDEKEYKEAISGLIARKSNNKYIANSVSGLKILYSWPRLKKIKCFASLISCRIESDGTVDICFRNKSNAKRIGKDVPSFRAGFYALPVIDCGCCCCASSVEFNCLFALKLDTALNTWNVFSSLFKDRKRIR